MFAQGAQILGSVATHVAHSAAMALCGITLAAVFWRLHRAHAAPHFRMWALAWVCVGVQHVVGGLLLTIWFSAPPHAALRTVMSIATQLSHYLEVVFMLLGVVALRRDSPIATRVVRALLLGATVATITLTLATIPASVEARLGLRYALRFALAGAAFGGTALLLLLSPRRTERLGSRLVAFSFGLISAVALTHAVWLNAGGDAAMSTISLEAINLANLFAHGLVGIGLVVWALEDQCALTERRGRDLNERTRQLLSSQKLEAIGRLAGGVAHDFNNVLTVVYSICEQLAREALPGTSTRTALGELQAAARQASKMTTQLLALASNRVQQPRLVDLARVTRDMATTLRRLLGDRCTLELEMPETSALARLQPGHVEQILLNLVVNARDAVASGSVIRIEVSNRTGAEERAELAVVDQGCGMPEDVRRRATEPFFTTKGERGTGIGLALVESIVSQCEGTVHIDSIAGKGTTVRVSWPRVAGLADESDVRLVAIPQPPPPVPPTATPTVRSTLLLAEDEPAVLEVTAYTLEHAGYRVLPAANAARALEIAAAHPGPIDALLTDVLMPGMNGPDLARAMRQARPDTKILFMSGFVDRRSEQLMGQDAPLLPKPFTRQQLLAYVQEHLGVHA